MTKTRRNFKVGQSVKALYGAYTGQIGVLTKKGGGQYDVTFPDGKTRYFDVNGIEAV